MAGVEQRAKTLRKRIEQTIANHPDVLEEVRGLGMMLGIKAVVPAGDLVAAMRDRHVLVVPAGDNVMRFLPPLVIDDSHIDEAITALEDACVALKP